MRRLASRVEGGQLLIQCGEEIWEIGDWLADGVGRIGWARMRIMGDAGSLSRRLAQAGIRDKFELSRSRAISKPTPGAP